MIIHFILSVLLLVLLLPIKNLNEKSLIRIIFIIFFVISAFRGYDIGNDTSEYYRFFNMIEGQSSLEDAIAITRYEPGYVVLNYIVSRFTNNFTWILVIISGIYLSSIYYYIQENAYSKKKAVVLFFTFSMFYSVMNLERQCIAISILLYSFIFLENKKYIKYCLLVLLSALFHKVSLIFIMLCFLPQIELNNTIKLIKIFIGSVLILMGIDYGTKFIISYLPYLGHYITSSIYSEGGIRIASIVFCCIRLITIMLVFFLGGFTSIDNCKSEKMYLLSNLLIVDCILSVASIGFNMYDRIELFIRIAFIVAIVNILERMNCNSNKKFIYSLLLISSFFYLTIALIYRSNWFGIYPYLFFWEY